MTACGDDSGQSSTDAAADGAQDATSKDATSQDARRETGPLADVGVPGDGGLPAPPAGCYSAADCTDAGPGALCCYLMTTMAIACVPQGGQCPYRQCQACDNECPVGLSCVASPFGGRIKYCAAADGGGAGSDGSGQCGSPEAGVEGGDGGDAGDGGDGGAAVDSGGDVESGSTEAATDAPPDTAADVVAADAHE